MRTDIASPVTAGDTRPSSCRAPETSVDTSTDGMASGGSPVTNPKLPASSVKASVSRSASLPSCTARAMIEAANATASAASTTMNPPIVMTRARRSPIPRPIMFSWSRRHRMAASAEKAMTANSPRAPCIPARTTTTPAAMSNGARSETTTSGAVFWLTDEW